MKKTVTVENVVFGEGRPKIIVPIVAKNRESILQAAKEIQHVDCDVVEWRIDFFDEVTEPKVVAELSHQVKNAIQKPLLVTFRTKKEGGELEISDELYFAIYHELLQSGNANLIDVELFMEDEPVAELVNKAHEKNVKVVMCNHDFDATPSSDEIVRRLSLMQDKNADICKIAVMPNSVQDVLTLLKATTEMSAIADRPLITMSMGSLGMISRVAGETFGSSATFGAAKQASAPGQVSVDVLRDILNTLKQA